MQCIHRRVIILFFAVALSVLFAKSSTPEGKKRFSMIDVFDLEYASDPQISPDGQRIVYVRTSMDIMKDRRTSTLWMITPDGSGHRPVSSASQPEFSPRWSPDGSRLAYGSMSSNDTQQIFLRWMDTGTTAKLTQLTQPFGDLYWSPDGKWLAFSMFIPQEKKPMATLPEKPEGAEWATPAKVIDKMVYRADGEGYLKAGYWHLFLLPAEGGTPRQITQGDFDHQGKLAWTPDSKSLLFGANRNADWEFDPFNSEIYEISIETGAIKPLTQRKGPDRSPALSPDGRLIAYLGFDDRYQFYQVDRLSVMNRDGSNSKVISEKLDRDVQDPIWSVDGKSVVFQYDDQGHTKIARITVDGKIQDLAEDVGGTELDRPYSSGSFSVAKNGTFVYPVSRFDSPADLASGSLLKPEARRLTSLNDDLISQRELGTVEEIWYQSSKDQRKIEGWIVKPPGFDPSKKYPLILEIHGGPVANYGPRFAADPQLYAAAGYVVLYTNPRGSDSYGEEFGNLIHHNYPGDDYFDLMSGVDAVIAKGYVDPENLFVTGGS